MRTFRRDLPIVAFGVLWAVLAGESQGLELGAVSLQFLRRAWAPADGELLMGPGRWSASGPTPVLVLDAPPSPPEDAPHRDLHEPGVT